VGDVISFQETITAKQIDQFAEISGDYAALHMGDTAAKKRGFRGRVVHGVLLTGFLSKLVGMHLDQENELLVSMNVKFVNPSYVGDKLDISAIVDQVSEFTNSIVLKAKIEIKGSQMVILNGKLIVSFDLKI
jgi:3-hydroxybutyryl-CoA dehydratase